MIFHRIELYFFPPNPPGKDFLLCSWKDATALKVSDFLVIFADTRDTLGEDLPA